MHICFRDERNISMLKLNVVYECSRRSFPDTIKTNLCSMDIGRIVQKELWGKSYPFAKYLNSTSSFSPNPSMDVILLMNVFIEGENNTKRNSLLSITHSFINVLITLELNGQLTLTINRHAHSNQENINQDMKLLCDPYSNKKGLFKLLSHVFLIHNHYARPVGGHPSLDKNKENVYGPNAIFYRNVSNQLPIQYCKSKKDTLNLSMVIKSDMEEWKAENYVMSDVSPE